MKRRHTTLIFPILESAISHLSAMPWKLFSVTNGKGETPITVKNNNCSAPYICRTLYWSARVTKKENKTVIRLYKVEGNGNWEKNRVGSITGFSSWWDYQRVFFSNASDIKSHLIQKFGQKESANYHIVEVEVSALEVERASRTNKSFKIIARSASFHVMVSKSGQLLIVASPRICICDQCYNE